MLKNLIRQNPERIGERKAIMEFLLAVYGSFFFAVVVHTSIYIDERDVVRETPLAEIVVYSRDELPSDSVDKLDYF